MRITNRKTIIPGLGHPVHKLLDPRIPRLFEIAETNGLSGRYVALIQLIGETAEHRYARSLPVNVTEAIGAVASEMQVPWQGCRGLGIMARAIGLVAHILEESRNPWRRTFGCRLRRKPPAI